MDSPEPTSPRQPAADPQQEEEIRSLLLRLMRLLAAEVSESFRRSQDSAPPPADR
jgi:hypothetical protein